MAKRVYLSNISAVWSFPAQEKALAVLPGWPRGYIVFRDELDARQRRLRSAVHLAQRAEMLHGTTRPGLMEAVYMAALPVFAVSMEDMIASLTLAGTRGATVHFLAEGLVVSPASGAETLHQVALAFIEGKRASRAKGAGQISADKRSDEARAKCETIRPMWPLASEDYPTQTLLDQAGVSLNTAKLYLGARPEAQRLHRIELTRQAAASKRKAKREEAQGA